MLEIYTKSSCPVCQNAKALLNANDVEFIEYQIGQNINRDEVLAKFPDARTVPIVIKDGERIGGFSELKLLMEQTNGQALDTSRP